MIDTLKEKIYNLNDKLEEKTLIRKYKNNLEKKRALKSLWCKAYAEEVDALFSNTRLPDEEIIMNNKVNRSRKTQAILKKIEELS